MPVAAADAVRGRASGVGGLLLVLRVRRVRGHFASRDVASAAAPRRCRRLPHGDERRRAHLSVAAAVRDAVRDCGIDAKVAHSVDAKVAHSVDAVDAAYGAADTVVVTSEHTHDHHQCGTRGLPLRCSATAVADGGWRSGPHETQIFSLAPRGWALRQSGQQNEHTTTTAAYAACGRTHS